MGAALIEVSDSGVVRMLRFNPRLRRPMIKAAGL